MCEHIKSVFVFSIDQYKFFSVHYAFLFKLVLYNVPFNRGLAPFRLFSEMLAMLQPLGWRCANARFTTNGMCAKNNSIYA